jgi:hypothetical protein
MFTANDIRNRMRTQPFVPLRIVTSSGQAFDVHHPDLVLIGGRELIVGQGTSNNPTFYDSITRVAIMHVTALQDLPTPPLANTNGEQGGAG